MPVPLLDVNAQNHPLEEELTAAFRTVLRGGQFILGSEVGEFEKECALFTGVPFNLAVSSGTDAIMLALMALGIGPGDEVIVPAFTFFATAGSVSRVGATPVFCDVQEGTFNLDPADAASRITPRTKAIIPVHLFGQMADMDIIMDLARVHDLRVVEDAAQAFGASFKGRPAGSIGDFGCFSFFPSKNLGALGDAGLLSCRESLPAERARILRVHGMEPKYHHREIGANFRMDTLQAAFLRVKLQRYSSFTAARQANAVHYDDCLRAAASPAQGKESGASARELILPVTGPDRSHIWNQYTLRVPGEGRRDDLRSHLQARGIGCEIYYPLSLDQQHCYRHQPPSEGLRTARRLASEALSIPVYPELEPRQREEVTAAIMEWLGGLV